jgi:Na+-driven multidrug efflux pump
LPLTIVRSSELEQLFNTPSLMSGTEADPPPPTPESSEQPTAAPPSHPEKATADTRLGDSPPLSTLMHLVGGPLCSQVTSSGYGLIDSMWISRRIGMDGLAATSISYVVDYIGLAFGHFVNVAATTRISFLFGDRRQSDISQVVVDLLRICVILGIIVPAILIPASRPIMAWLSDYQEDIAYLAYIYLLPVLAGAINGIVLMFLCGVLQAEGRSWLLGSVQVVSFVLNGLVFDPLFLFAFNTGVRGGGIATMLSELIPAVVILVFLVRGDFEFEITPRQFLAPFSPETRIACKAGAASFVLQLSNVIPAIFVQKYMVLTAEKLGEFDDLVGIWNVILRLNHMVVCVVVAFTTAYLPAASYAYGGGNYRRIISLTLHLLWTTAIWTVACELLVVLGARPLGSIWSDGDDFLNWVSELLPHANYCVFLSPIPLIAANFLTAIDRPGYAAVLSIATQLLPLPIFSSILYFTDQQNPGRLTYSYSISDGFAALLAIILVAKPLYDTVGKAKDQAVKPADELNEIEAGLAPETEETTVAP